MHTVRLLLIWSVIFASFVFLRIVTNGIQSGNPDIHPDRLNGKMDCISRTSSTIHPPTHSTALGANWASVSGPRTLWHVDCRSWGSKLRQHTVRQRSWCHTCNTPVNWWSAACYLTLHSAVCALGELQEKNKRLRSPSPHPVITMQTDLATWRLCYNMSTKATYFFGGGGGGCNVMSASDGGDVVVWTHLIWHHFPL